MNSKIIRTVVAIAGLVTLVAACGAGDEMGDYTLAPGAATATPQVAWDSDAPAATGAPASDKEAAPGTEASPATQSEGRDGDESQGGSPNLLDIAAIVLLVAGVAFLFSRGARSGPGRSGAEPARVATGTTDLDGRVLDEISRFHGQLSLDLISAGPHEARERWRSERPQIEGLTRDCQRLEESTGNRVWGALAGEMVALAQSLDTVTLSRADADPVATRQAIDLVHRHRSRLSGLATQVTRR